MSRVFVGLWVAVGCWAVMATDAPAPRPVDVAPLVRQLGSDDFQERETATNRLAALPLDAPPVELLDALKSSDPEVRDRAAKAVQAIRTRFVVKQLPRGEKFATRGEIDLFVAATAVWELRADDARLWEPALAVGRVAIAKADLAGVKKPNGCPATFKDFPTYNSLFNPRLIRTNGVYVPELKDAAGNLIRAHPEGVHAVGVTNPRWISGPVVSRGDVSTKTVITSSLILANGNVTCEDDLNSSIVICDGDVSVGRQTSMSLIVARGNIHIKGAAFGGTLIAGGTVTIANPHDRIPMGLENTVLQKESNPLGFITFFELRRIGLDVKVADGAVRVAALAAGNVCEKAGLKVGDAVVEVNGKKPTDAESLRRLLRDALAVGEATVKLQRGKDTITAKLSLPD